MLLLIIITILELMIMKKKDPLAFEYIVDTEESESEEKSQPNKESTNSEGNSGNKDNDRTKRRVVA